jgi:hypothetical protein
MISYLAGKIFHQERLNGSGEEAAVSADSSRALCYPSAYHNLPFLLLEQFRTLLGDFSNRGWCILRYALFD